MEQRPQDNEIAKSRRLMRRDTNASPAPPKDYLFELARLVLPPFLLKVLMVFFGTCSSIFLFCKEQLTSSDRPGDTSKEFNKRRFETNIEDLGLEQQDLGFTNQILCEEDNKGVNLYLPVYVACKIKSIQDVSVQSLTGNVSCALIINVKYGDLPEEIVRKLENSIVLQLNRSESMILAHDGLGVTLKRNQKAEFLTFTLRKVFLAFMIEDTFWSPFEVLDLVISLTLNTVTIAHHSLPLLGRTGYDPSKQYKISFNCMRNSDLIPMSFDLDCVYGVYDLAERRLESYHTNISTYKQVQKNHRQFLEEKINGSNNKKKKSKKKYVKLISKRDETLVKETPSTGQEEQMGKLLSRLVMQTVRGLAVMRQNPKKDKQEFPKVKYFQYTHLVISVYKYPGNVLITIFLPVLLLALLSLAIFFQSPDLSGRIGSIATMFLGYIALIPSIKEQLPPSAKLTVMEALVYIEALSCMLCLYESFLIRECRDYVFDWSQNSIFLLCLFIHSSVFLFVLGLYCIHKVRWQPSYNCNQQIPEIRPADNSISWDNPFCDHTFLKHNKKIHEIIKENENSSKDRNNNKLLNKLIKPYVNTKKEPSASDIQSLPKNREEPPPKKSEPQSHEVSWDLFESVKEINHKPKRFNHSKTRTQGMEDCSKIPTSPHSMSKLAAPDQQIRHYFEI